MALKDLVTDLGSFYESNPFAAKFKTKAGPTYAQIPGRVNQRSFKYGDDRPDGGSSKQPFIKSVLPDVNSNPTSATGLLAGITRQITARVDDLQRIGRFLITPKGLLFIAKQNILSTQNPIVPGRPNRSGPLKGFYNPLITLAQVATSGTGIHLEKQGLLPIGFNNDEVKYEKEYLRLSTVDPGSTGLSAVAALIASGAGLERSFALLNSIGTSNRLENLYLTKILLRSPLKKSQLTATGISTNPNLLLSYPGGPGITRTNIKFADRRVYGGDKHTVEAVYLNSEALFVPEYKLTQFTEASSYLQLQAKKLTEQEDSGSQYLFENLRYVAIREKNAGRFNTITPEKSKVYREDGTQVKGKSTTTYSKQYLDQQDSQGIVGSATLIGPDFRRNIRVIPGDFEQIRTGVFGENAVDYSLSTVNKIQRVGLGDPGLRSRDRSNLYVSDKRSIDKVSNFPLYKDSSAASSVGDTRDFIRFRFEVLSNDDSSLKTYVHFRAFLGAITDNFTGEWNPTTFVGRGDKFYNYTGFSRGISLSFKVHPQTRDEMAAMYQKLTYLASTLAPDYSGEGGYMKGNITKLTIGSYFYRIPGFISNLTYTVPEDASWEIAYNEPEGGAESSQLETPRHFDVSFEFTPIHNFAPQLMDGTRNYALFTPDQANSGQRNPYLTPLKDKTSIIATSSDDAENADSLKRIADNKAAKEAEAAKKAEAAKNQKVRVTVGPLGIIDEATFINNITPR
jgi:hypothetical protein